MNTWTTILTPTELEKTFAQKKVDKSSNKPRTIQITHPDGTTQTFNGTMQAARSLGVTHPTIKSRCEKNFTDRQGNQYRYI